MILYIINSINKVTRSSYFALCIVENIVVLFKVLSRSLQYMYKTIKCSIFHIIKIVYFSYLSWILQHLKCSTLSCFLKSAKLNLKKVILLSDHVAGGTSIKHDNRDSQAAVSKCGEKSEREPPLHVWPQTVPNRSRHRLYRSE